MTEMLAVITITLLAVISPGADFALVSRNSLLLSRRAGLWTAVGIGLGTWIHLGGVLLGLGVVLQRTPWLFTTLKLCGAGYLLWLGVGMLRGAGAHAIREVEARPISSRAALRMGLLSNALNPKTTMFILSLFLQVIEPTTPWAVQLGYGLFISGVHVAWFALVALGFSEVRIRARVLSLRPWLERLSGGVLVGFGLLLMREGR
ncbi:LysE family translocator [Pseudomonas oryzihabitans]|uniref:RhtB (Resistance to homoserine/threonine) family protein n=1 Tax=Pseudomonas oryzihabitans TaxID=47885 RepID=A0AAJ2BZV8_9PSED|nr:LysE family transporter [Pseudomonas psychrotolerans]MDR6235613.1 RhtB (resistance to homoserine/threonine) family protein [Pseudomonas psychrotolerans]